MRRLRGGQGSSGGGPGLLDLRQGRGGGLAGRQGVAQGGTGFAGAAAAALASWACRTASAAACCACHSSAVRVAGRWQPAQAQLASPSAVVCSLHRMPPHAAQARLRDARRGTRRRPSRARRPARSTCGDVSLRRRRASRDGERRASVVSVAPISVP